MRGVDDQFMFGLDLLITPVLEQRADDRSVYLPAGTEWTDARTGVGQVGGTEATTDTPLERMTMLLREGAQIDIAIFDTEG
jgi:alpha-D-xyloside xylohydrolase